jgi:hypothetical protein
VLGHYLNLDPPRVGESCLRLIQSVGDTARPSGVPCYQWSRGGDTTLYKMIDSLGVYLTIGSVSERRDEFTFSPVIGVVSRSKYGTRRIFSSAFSDVSFFTATYAFVSTGSFTYYRETTSCALYAATLLTRIFLMLMMILIKKPMPLYLPLLPQLSVIPLKEGVNPFKKKQR